MCHQRLAAAGGTQVGLGDQGAAACAADPLGNRRRLLFALPVRHEDRCPRPPERLGDGGADAAARARDHGPHTVEPAPARLRHILALSQPAMLYACRRYGSSRRCAEAQPPRVTSLVSAPTTSPAPRSWPACWRQAPRSRATSRRATTSTTPPTRTCCAAGSPSAPSSPGRA